MDLDLTHYHQFLKLIKQGKERQVFDPVRKSYFMVQPEELVRQSWIAYLLQERSLSPASLAVEKQFFLFGGPRRFDLVIYRKAAPVMLCEFKSFNTKLSDRACRQAAAYNHELRIPYILLSNGIQHRLFSVDHEQRSVNELTEWPVEI